MQNLSVELSNKIELNRLAALLKRTHPRYKSVSVPKIHDLFKQIDKNKERASYLRIMRRPEIRKRIARNKRVAEQRRKITKIKKMIKMTPKNFMVITNTELPSSQCLCDSFSTIVLK